MSKRGVWLKLRALARRRTVEAELGEEIAFHIERETEKNLHKGMTQTEARRAAMISFGGVEAVKEEYRDGRGDRHFSELQNDLRQAFRLWRRNPALVSAVVLTLALGIGANVAIFSAVNAVILRPLPFDRPERLAMLWEDNADKGWIQQSAAPANMLDWKAEVSAFEDVAAYQDFAEEASVVFPDGPRPVSAMVVTGNFFKVLGVSSQIGQVFSDEDTWQTGKSEAVLSAGLWRREFASDSSVIGKIISLDGREVRVLGVMPSNFAFPSSDTDIWLPTAWQTSFRTQTFFRRAHWMRPFARLKDGVSFDQASAELRGVMSRLEERFPETNTNMKAGMGPLHDYRVQASRAPLLVLLGATGLLMLIACANVANLLLVRAAAREREVVLRRALGAGSGRVARQTLTESLVLSLAGGVVGLALGWWGTKALATLQPEGLLPVSEVAPDMRVFVFVLLLASLNAALFGVVPALWSAARNAADVLKESVRTSSQSRRLRRFGNGLVVTEVALALVLTIGAALMARTLRNLTSVDPGFDPSGVFAATLTLPSSSYTQLDEIVAFDTRLRERVAALQGVESVALASQIPLADYNAWTSGIAVKGRPEAGATGEIAHRTLTPGYFRTMRVPLIAGRDFGEDDRIGGEPVVVVNKALADRYLGGTDPIGQMIAFDREPSGSSTWYRIVGVSGNEAQDAPGQEFRSEVFAPLAQDPRRGWRLLVRTTGEPRLLERQLEAVLREIDPRRAFLSTTTMEEALAASLSKERFMAVLLVVFSCVGVLLAIVGVYGVVAQLALRRTGEMGVRLALGAQASDVRWLVVRHGLILVGVGVVAGGAVAAAASGVLQRMLYGVGTLDPLTFILVPAGILLTGLVASWVPARRVTRTDPAMVLRE